MTERSSTNINSIAFEDFLKIALKSGVHLTASKGFGKTRFLFSCAKALMKKSRVFIFDGSLAWLFGFSQIPVFVVKERDISLAAKIETTEQIERYSLNNWQLVKTALENYQSLLFDIRTRKPSKRGFFVRSVVNYLDAQQRTEILQSGTHKPKDSISYFIEEAQDCFNSRSTTRLEAEEFLTVFNEARNQQEAFFTASQRLTDFSKTIRSKQNYLLGSVNYEDKSGFIRRLEKRHGLNFSEMKPRTWLFNGQLLESPQWKQSGKPYKINASVIAKFRREQPQPQKPKKKTLTQKVSDFLSCLNLQNWINKHGLPQTELEDMDSEETEELDGINVPLDFGEDC
jgi:hypothetical protein